jgi:hypothetical protein
MSQKPIPRKPELLTAAIIAEMAVCEERGDAQCAGLRVRYSASGRKIFSVLRSQWRAAGVRIG